MANMDAVLERLQTAIADTLGVTPEQIVPDAKFQDDLEADSLDLVEATMAVEEEFDIQVPEEELEGLSTVGDLITLIERKLDEKGG